MNAPLDSAAPGICERLAHAWVRQAARRSPSTLSERLEEEWLADLAAQQHGLAQLRFAAGCWWAKSVIAHEQLALQVTATALATPAANTAGLGAPLSSRTVFIALIVAVHGVVIYGFIFGLTPHLVPSTAPPNIDAVWIEEPRRHPAQVGPGNLTSLPLPLPEPRIPPPSIPDLGGVESVPAEPSNDPIPADPTSTPRVPIRVAGGPGKGFPSAEDFYPSASRRLEETGISTVRVCVNDRGQLTSAPTVVQSSGSVRLDEGALRLARAGSGAYRSSTEDGQSITDCFPFRIRFELKH